MTDDTTFRQITRYVFDECSRDEARVLERWIDSDPGRRAEAESLRRIRDAAGVGQVVDVEAGWARLSRPSFRLNEAVFNPPRRNWLRTAVGIAAALLLVVGAALIWRVVSPSTPQPVAMREAVAGPGERATFTLSDGTRVMLGVESRLRFARAFGPGAREVFLDGEAYFEVARDEARPFSVHAAGAVTRVLGTRFGVRAYRNDDAVQVVVAEGRVAVAATTDSVQERTELARDMLALVSRDGRTTVRQQIDVDHYLGWTEGRLAFHDTPLLDVAHRLERWYDLDVQIADPSLDTLLLTATFQYERVDDVLQVIASSLDVQYQRTGRSVRFLPKRPVAPR